jgi:hypothetical protein
MKRKVQRGSRESQARTLGCLSVASLSSTVDRLRGPDLAVDGVAEADEFYVAVALHSSVDDDSVEHAQRGE